MHIDSALRAKAGGAVKRLRRDLLTSVAAVAQLAETWRPDAFVGIVMARWSRLPGAAPVRWRLR